MLIKPPQIEVPENRDEHRRLNHMTSALLTFGIILLITVAVWMALWGGGIKQAVQSDSRAATESVK
jgi:hypothetical protein